MHFDFFDVRVIAHFEFLAQGGMKNDHINKKIMCHLLDSVHGKRPKLWQEKP